MYLIPHYTPVHNHGILKQKGDLWVNKYMEQDNVQAQLAECKGDREAYTEISPRHSIIRPFTVSLLLSIIQHLTTHQTDWIETNAVVDSYYISSWRCSLKVALWHAKCYKSNNTTNFKYARNITISHRNTTTCHNIATVAYTRNIMTSTLVVVITTYCRSLKRS